MAATKIRMKDQDGEITPSTVYENALAWFLGYGTINDRAVLHLLRIAEQEGVHTHDQVTFREWAMDNFYLMRSRDAQDKMNRFVNVIIRMTIFLDLHPIDTSKGLIDGAALIDLAYPTSLVKFSNAFAEADADKKAWLVEKLVCGATIKDIRKGGGSEKVPPIYAVKRILEDGRYELSLKDMSDEQLAYVEEVLDAVIQIHLM